MRWGENKNAHPKHGTDVRFASVVPPNLGYAFGVSLTLIAL